MQKQIHKAILGMLFLISMAFSYENQILHLIEKELDKTEKQIDVGYLCLLLAKDAFPSIDIQKTLLLFDGMAKNVSIICESSKDKMPLPDKRIGSLNTFLYRVIPTFSTDFLTI
jgi:hypothetical protein